MKLDSYGLLYLEGPVNGSAPGCFGDAAAETGRYYNLLAALRSMELLTKEAEGTAVHGMVDYVKNVTTVNGYIRHPLVPDDWKETDFTTDQALPLYLAVKNWGFVNPKLQMQNRIKNAGYKTGNGKLVSPGFFFMLKGWRNLADLMMLLQALIFILIPFRWDDGKKKITGVGDNSGDYLNFTNQLIDSYINKPTIFARITSLLFSKVYIFNKIKSYYKDDPDVEWLLNAYKPIIDNTFR